MIDYSISVVEFSWQMNEGTVTCAAYALPQIDTIDTKTGEIDSNSALNLVVFGVSDFFLIRYILVLKIHVFYY